MNQSASERGINSRRGTILIVVLVCLGIASSITGVAIQSSLRDRRQIHQEWQLEQTLWLLDAGIRRTYRSANNQTDYEGEVWDVSDSLERYASARVVIRRLDQPPTASGEAALRFEIIATLENKDVVPVRTRRSKTLAFTAATDPPNEEDASE